MGVAVAWPENKYDLVTVDNARLADDIPEKPWARRDVSKATGVGALLGNLKARLGKVVSALRDPLERPRPPFDAWYEAKRRAPASESFGVEAVRKFGVEAAKVRR